MRGTPARPGRKGAGTRRIGILGAGGIAELHLKAIARHPRAECVHIADLRGEVAHRIAGTFNIPRVSTDARDLVADPDVDLVVVALPTFLHREWILRAAGAGKDILTEKPLCRTVAEGRSVIRACRERRVHLEVGYLRRSFAWELNKLKPVGMDFSWLLYQQLDSFMRFPVDPVLPHGEEALASLWISEKTAAAPAEGRVFTWRS